MVGAFLRGDGDASVLLRSGVRAAVACQRVPPQATLRHALPAPVSAAPRYKFRPTADNPYLRVRNEDDDEEAGVRRVHRGMRSRRDDTPCPAPPPPHMLICVPDPPHRSYVFQEFGLGDDADGDGSGAGDDGTTGVEMTQKAKREAEP